MISFDRMLAGHMRVFGQPARYMPGGNADAGFDVRGVFDRAHHQIEISAHDGAPITSTRPVLGVRAAEFTQPPACGDCVQIGGETFYVTDPQPDGHGHIKLILSKTLE